MKKILLWLLLIIAAWLFVRFILGGSEDSWLCVDGQRVKHGYPSVPMPERECKN